MFSLHGRRTKIIATLGPSSDSPEMIKKLIEKGVDAFRINLAHGTPEQHEEKVKLIRELSGERFVAVIADIRGSKIRVGKMPPKGVLFERGSAITIDANASDYRNGIIPVPSMIRVKKGSVIFLDDGMIALKVRRDSYPKIHCEVVREGRLFSRKGVNIPGSLVRSSPKRDAEDIMLGKKLGVDYISLSFIKSAKDVERARALLKGMNIGIIGKIESPKALEKLDDIAKSVDAVMIARGDLGLEIPLAEVPLRQKEIVETCHMHGVPVIVATQMLASMVNTLMPTRAEVSDVANAVFDSADAVMLSGETASGLYPLETVSTMNEIVEQAEKMSLRYIYHGNGSLPVNVAIAKAACETARSIDAKLILVGTATGFSAKAVARNRPSAPIIAITEYKYVAQQLSLVWGVKTVYLPGEKGITSSLEAAIKMLRRRRALKKGDAVVYVYGIKFGKPGSTNVVRVISID